MNRVTMLDDLPRLDDIESKYSSSPDGNKFQKFIRNNGYTTPSESGMGMPKSVFPPIPYNPQLPQQNVHPQQFPQQNNMAQPFSQHSTQQSFYPMSQQSGYDSTPSYQPYTEETPIEHYQHDDLSCLRVSRHATNCQVCSRLYNNNLNVILFTLIVLQIIIVLILLRQLNLV